MPEADALLAWGAPITAEMIAVARPRLACAIARAATAIQPVDLAAASARLIVVSNTPGANAESVAEQTFALLLALTRNILDNDRQVSLEEWNRTALPPRLRWEPRWASSASAGSAGRWRGARSPLACASLPPSAPAVPRVKVLAQARSSGVRLDDLLAESDVVSLHLRLTPDTQGLFDRRAFSRMRPGALFLNTARGALVVERDLIASLASGHLGGAGLDVQESELTRAPDNPLLACPNIVFSPHVGAVDTEALDCMAEQAAQCVVALYQGHWPEGFVINEELRPCWRW